MGGNDKGRGTLGTLFIALGVLALALGFGMFVLDAIAIALLFLLDATLTPLPSSFVLMAAGVVLLLVGRIIARRRTRAPLGDS